MLYQYKTVEVDILTIPGRFTIDASFYGSIFNSDKENITERRRVVLIEFQSESDGRMA